MSIAIVCLDKPLDESVIHEAGLLSEKGHQVMVIYSDTLENLHKPGTLLWRDVKAEMLSRGLSFSLSPTVRLFDRVVSFWNEDAAFELIMRQRSRLYASTVRHFLDQFGPKTILSCPPLSTRCVIWDVGYKAKLIHLLSDCLED